MWGRGPGVPDKVCWGWGTLVQGKLCNADEGPGIPGAAGPLWAVLKRDVSIGGAETMGLS